MWQGVSVAPMRSQDLHSAPWLMTAPFVLLSQTSRPLHQPCRDPRPSDLSNFSLQCLSPHCLTGRLCLYTLAHPRATNTIERPAFNPNLRPTCFRQFPCVCLPLHNKRARRRTDLLHNPLPPHPTVWSSFTHNSPTLLLKLYSSLFQI